uniref:NFKB inhibitor beta n=1 Tax=Ornithorhynchus anatinus TaxID=9258 RepID=A0A6I8PDQ6_ORNAN
MAAKAAEAAEAEAAGGGDDWCDSGLGSLGGAAAAAAAAGDWAPGVLGHVTEDGDTVLHLAVIHQHEAFLEFLLQYTAGTQYLDLQNDLGQTALHIAVILGDATLAAKLRAAGAGLCVTERAGNTALHLACREGWHACARALLDPPGSAHRDKEEEEEEQRLQRDSANYQGHTPLHVAVIRKDLEMVRLLRDAGVDLNKQVPPPGPRATPVPVGRAAPLPLLPSPGSGPPLLSAPAPDARSRPVAAAGLIVGNPSPSLGPGGGGDLEREGRGRGSLTPPPPAHPGTDLRAEPPAPGGGGPEPGGAGVPAAGRRGPRRPHVRGLHAPVQRLAPTLRPPAPAAARLRGPRARRRHGQRVGREPRRGRPGRQRRRGREWRGGRGGGGWPAAPGS